MDACIILEFSVLEVLSMAHLEHLLLFLYLLHMGRPRVSKMVHFM